MNFAQFVPLARLIAKPGKIHDGTHSTCTHKTGAYQYYCCLHPRSPETLSSCFKKALENTICASDPWTLHNKGAYLCLTCACHSRSWCYQPLCVWYIGTGSCCSEYHLLTLTVLLISSARLLHHGQVS